jgi:hypothetical protein
MLQYNNNNKIHAGTLINLQLGPRSRESGSLYPLANWLHGVVLHLLSTGRALLYSIKFRFV